MDINYIDYTILENNEFYALTHVSFDFLLQKFTMRLNRYPVYYFSRRTAAGQFSLGINTIVVMIEQSIPVIKEMKNNKMSNESISKEIQSNWKQFLEYAIEGYNESWVTYTIGDIKTQDDCYSLAEMKVMLKDVFHFNDKRITEITRIRRKYYIPYFAEDINKDED